VIVVVIVNVNVNVNGFVAEIFMASMRSTAA
jgi:hypothetical protein